MIAVDTSTLSAYLAGETGPDVAKLDAAIAAERACLPPIVVAEILSGPMYRRHLQPLLSKLPLLQITQGYWDRCGHLRHAILASGRKAALADTLIAQSCLDHSMPLITRDSDFRHFAKYGGLKLA